MTDPHVIPFGKHKGKPVEVLAGDPSYADWLLGQGWFQERHPNLYTVIVNNYGEPAETPEHNNLQGKFVDDGFCLRFLDVYRPGWAHKSFVNWWQTRIKDVESWINKIAEADKRDIRYGRLEPGRPDWYRRSLQNEISHATAWTDNLLRDGLTFESMAVVRRVTKRAFECNSSYGRGVIDVFLGANASIDELDMHAEINLEIELKPSVGDDYPAILRQMRANGARCLLLKDYCGVGVTRRQFVEIFKSAGITVVFLEDVDPLPPVVQYDYE